MIPSPYMKMVVQVVQGNADAINTHTYIILFKNLKGRDNFGDMCVGGGKILKIILQKQDMTRRTKVNWKLQPMPSKCRPLGVEATSDL
jgi:hypothetical protein